MFSHLVLQTLSDPNNRSNALWSLICGANFINKDAKLVYYPSMQEFKLVHRQFIDALMGLFAQFITICEDIHVSPNKLTHCNIESSKMPKMHLNRF